MEKLQNLTRSDLNFFINQNIQIDLQNFVISLVCAAILSFLVQLFYVRYSSTLSNRREFAKKFRSFRGNNMHCNYDRKKFFSFVPWSCWCFINS